MLDAGGQYLGRQFGNYRLIKILGRGGFADVYLGEHIHLVGKQVAVKVLTTLLTSDQIDLFRNEAQTIAELEHPNIVSILDFGMEGHTPYIIMPYAQNGSLRTLYPRGTRLSLQTALAYTKQIAAPLQYAHERQLIHRDVKPDNILVGRHNEVLLSDFGLVTVAKSTRNLKTQDQSGTVEYMAPEQIQGKPRPSSDQYALGVIVYEWLSGTLPFAGTAYEIAMQHLAHPPQPLREKMPSLPSAIEQVVLKALEKDPHQRFHSIQEFADNLINAEKLSPPIVPNRSIQVPSSDKQVQRPPPSLLPLKSPQLSHPPTLGSILCQYREHTLPISMVSWSRDGRRIASGSWDGSVHVWDTTDGQSRLTYQEHQDAVYAVAWSPTRDLVASAGRDRTVHVWEPTTGRTIGIYRGHAERVTTVAWSYDGTRIATSSWDNTIQIWDATTAKALSTYHLYGGWAESVTWSANGKRLAVAGNTTAVQVWDTSTGKNDLLYKKHLTTVKVVAWSPNGAYVASGSEDGIVHIWNVAGRTIVVYKEQHEPISALAWAADSIHVASASKDKTIHLWEATTGKTVFVYQGHTAFTSLAWSPEGTRIASGDTDTSVQVWQAK